MNTSKSYVEEKHTFFTHPRSSWSRLTTTTSAAPMTMTTMTGYNLWFHRDRGSLATGRQLEISYAIVKNDITEGKNTIRTAYRLVDCGNTTHCTVRHECAQRNDRWTYDDNDDDDDDDEQRVENVSLLPPPTPPSRLATLAAVLRMRDAASIVRMCTHFIPVSKLS